MSNPDIVNTLEGKILKNEQIVRWINGDTGDDANDGLTEGTAWATDAKLKSEFDGTKAAKECKAVVFKFRGTNVLTGEGYLHMSGGEAPGEDGPIVIFDGGTDLQEILAATVSDLNGSGLDEIMPLLNEIKLDYEAHRVLVAGSVHGGADTENVIESDDASNFDSSLDLANELKEKLNEHFLRTDDSVHGSEDTNQEVTADFAFDLLSLTILANDLKAQYEAHRVDVSGAPAIHGAADATNVVATADATKATAKKGAFIGLSTATWTDGEWMGYLVEYVDGPRAGELDAIWWNSPTEIYLNREQTLDPGAGTTFRIVAPATVIDGGDPFSFATLGGEFSGRVRAHMQGLTFTNGALPDLAGDSAAVLAIARTVLECKPFQIFPMFLASKNPSIQLTPTLWDVSGDLPVEVEDPDQIGVTQVGPTFEPFVLNAQGSPFIDSCVFPRSSFDGVSPEIANSALGVIQMRNCSGFGGGSHRTFSKCRTGWYREDGEPATPVYPGTILELSSAQIEGGVHEGGTHAMVLFGGSYAVLRGGHGDNQLTGVYCRDGAVDLYRGGGASGVPEITGNGGTVDLSEDGVTEVSAWSAIDSVPVSQPGCRASQWFPYVNPEW